MKNLSKQEKILLSILAILGIVYIYFNIFLSPLLADLKAARKTLENYDNQLWTARNTKSQNEKLKKDIAALEDNFNEKLKVLPQSARLPEVIRNLKISADSNKITLNNVNFSNISSNSTSKNDAANANKKSDILKLNTVPVTLDISGQYKDISKFIDGLEKGERAAEILNVNINSSTGSQGTSSLRASISLNFIFAEGDNKVDANYDFNNGNYSKDNLFN